MHPTALSNGKLFFDTYVAPLGAVRVVEVGSQDVNGSLRQVAPPDVRYLGIDFAEGKGVDVVITDPYALPFDDGSIDVIVSSSCFEHSEMFWLVFLEIMRVLRPGGLFYLNVPSNGSFHRYPVDCWRFYPDCGGALVAWAERNGQSAALLESYTSEQRDEMWNDFVAVFVRDARRAGEHPRRITDGFTDFRNGKRLGLSVFLQPAEYPEDMRALQSLRGELTVARQQNRAIDAFQAEAAAHRETTGKYLAELQRQLAEAAAANSGLERLVERRQQERDGLQAERDALQRRLDRFEASPLMAPVQWLRRLNHRRLEARHQRRRERPLR